MGIRYIQCFFSARRVFGAGQSAWLPPDKISKTRLFVLQQPGLKRGSYLKLLLMPMHGDHGAECRPELSFISLFP